MFTRIITLIILLFLSYMLGRSHTQTKIVTEQIEVIKYVEQKKSQIRSHPNASRNTLLKLMYNNKL